MTYTMQLAENVKIAKKNIERAESQVSIARANLHDCNSVINRQQYRLAIESVRRTHESYEIAADNYRMWLEA